MAGSFGGGFLGGLLGGLLAPLVRAIGGFSIGGLFVGGMVLIVWWQRMAEWQQLLLVVVVLSVLLRWGSRPRYRRRPRVNPISSAPRYPNARFPHELENEPHWLYRWFDANENLLYVGISNDPERRMREHLDDPRKPWAREPGVQFEVEPEPYPTRTAVLEAEERAIWREGPLYNVVHNGR